MSRRDVVKYYLEQEASYLEMLKDIKDLEKDYKEGLITNEAYSNLNSRLLESIQIVKDNYNQLSYIMMLLNQPHRNSKKLKEHRQNNKIYKYLENEKCTQYDLYLENTNALANIKKIIKEEIN